jgi:hypothetical protein
MGIALGYLVGKIEGAVTDPKIQLDSDLQGEIDYVTEEFSMLEPADFDWG